MINDLEYPENLHDLHNDYPLAPEKLVVHDEWLSPYCKYLIDLQSDKTTVDSKKRKEKSPGSATITNRSPYKTPRGRESRQIQTSTNRTNVQKALRFALSSPSEVIAMLKGLKNTRTK